MSVVVKTYRTAVWFSPCFFPSTRLVESTGTHLDLLPTDRRSSARRAQEAVDHVDRGHALVGLEERVLAGDAGVVLNNIVRIEVGETHAVLPVVLPEEFCNVHCDLMKMVRQLTQIKEEYVVYTPIHRVGERLYGVWIALLSSTREMFLPSRGRMPGGRVSKHAQFYIPGCWDVPWLARVFRAGQGPRESLGVGGK